MALTALSGRPDHEIAGDAYDVEGWDVRTLIDDESVGEIHDVLLDAGGEARYLDIDLDVFKKHVLLPIGQARAQRDDEVVWIPGMTKERFRTIPAYEHDLSAVTYDYEGRLVGAYRSAYAGSEYRRTTVAGAVYGPSEAETRVHTERPPTLVRLGALEDFGIADDEPDPRGWTVAGSGGEPIGRVAELIIDRDAMKVRHLDCVVDEDGLGLESEDRHLLIPVGFARLNEHDRTAVVDVLNAETVAEMPLYTGGEVDRELETEFREHYDFETARERLYENPRFRARTFYGPADE